MKTYKIFFYGQKSIQDIGYFDNFTKTIQADNKEQALNELSKTYQIVHINSIEVTD